MIIRPSNDNPLFSVPSVITGVKSLYHLGDWDFRSYITGELCP